MLGFDLTPWTLLGLTGIAIVATFLANWLAGGLRKPALPRRVSLSMAVSAAASLLWVFLMTIAGMVAARYIERVGLPALGYLVFGLVGLSLSLLRARLYRQMVQQQRQREPGVWLPAFVAVNQARLVHNANYLVFALVLFLLLSWIAGRFVVPIALGFLALGAFLPDLDTRDSPLGRLLPFVSRPLESRFGHLQIWHSLGANALVAIIALPLVWVLNLDVWYALALGFLSHLALDLLAPEGVMLFWPFAHSRHRLGEGYIQEPGDRSERQLTAGLFLVAVVLLFAVDLGKEPAPQAAGPTYAQTLDRYRSLRGRNLVFAYVEGSWQATGRRLSGRFEILNASGGSYIMLDRFSGKIFAAGRGANDNLYVDRIVLQTGSAAAIKPAEIHLEDQLLGDSLDILYQMQMEAGLQHIFVSGDLLLDALPPAVPEALAVDYSQTSLRHIERQGDGHYRLSYLPAGSFLALASIPVQRADLVFVATIASPPTGPTVTPLPEPSATPESQP